MDVNDLLLFLAGMVLALILLLLMAWRIFRQDVRTEEQVEENNREISPGEQGIRDVGRDNTVTCQICLGEVEEGNVYRICPCGKPFHSICIARTGFCPYCNRPYVEKDFQAGRIEGEGRDCIESCPVCGRAISGDRCECGALFTDMQGGLVCPTCGAEISSGEDVCNNCGETFETFREKLCPICLNTVHEGQTICQCGLVLDDLCPECGWKLGAREDTCPICGLDFELVPRRDDLY